MKPSSNHIRINIQEQSLSLYKENQRILHYAISSAKNGLGERNGSECTPRGWHRVRAMMGNDCPINTVFVGRRVSGEIYTQALAEQHPQRDWILTRILWLSGMEIGRNRLAAVDTQQRYIYIHGCPDHCIMGKAESHGCIRMRNQDVIELYDHIDAGIDVYIGEESS